MSLERVEMIESIRAAIIASWPDRFDPGALRDDLSIGADGLGLDSVEVVEVILACEERCGRSATEELFAVVPLTIEGMADYFLS